MASLVIAVIDAPGAFDARRRGRLMFDRNLYSVWLATAVQPGAPSAATAG
jgi:hypothetical protein